MVFNLNSVDWSWNLRVFPYVGFRLLENVCTLVGFNTKYQVHITLSWNGNLTNFFS